MSVVNRSRFLRMESRSRPRGGTSALAAAFVTGAILRNAPAQVQNLSARGQTGFVRFSWDAVTETDAGRPLEAFARYLVLVKRGTGPNIDAITWENYDDLFYVDNTFIELPVRRVLHNNTYVTEWVAVRVLAADRYGRLGKPSTQVEATSLAVRVPEILDFGTIIGWSPLGYTVVQTWDVLTVPPGYMYVVTVFPLFKLEGIGAYEYTGFGPWITHSFYGLFWYGVVPSAPILMPGTYYNVDLAVFHISDTLGGVNCWDDLTEEAALPLWNFDFANPGNMNLGGILKEGDGNAYVLFSYDEVLYNLPVFWILWKIPL